MLSVTPIAYTLVDWDAVVEAFPESVYTVEAPLEFTVTDADHLGELAGRSCYKAYDRKRAETSDTEGYLAHILEQGHFSVLEHASVTFYVKGVSRALLVELERHRFLSFSVESQRYVNQIESHPEPVIPPAIADSYTLYNGITATEALKAHYQLSQMAYERAVDMLRQEGYTLKEAREAARAFLPNSTPVDMIVTGNLRAWRDVLGKRYHAAADAEIREFATEILRHLRSIAPLSVQDFPDDPFTY